MQRPRVRFSARGRNLAAVAGVLLLLTPAALAQEAVPLAPPSAPAAQPAPAPKPGLFEAIGRWFDEGAAEFQTHLRGAKQRIDSLGIDAAETNREIGDRAAGVGKGAVEVTKAAVGAVVRLPTTRVMKGHERCAAAPNGAPDCIAAANALCRKHGFSSGKSVDFTSAEECPVQVHLAGRQAGAECYTVTFISRAMCQ